jgi:hypothetical protein
VNPAELLGDVAAEVVCGLIRKGETGMRLLEITPLEYNPFLRALVRSDVHPRVVLAGMKAAEAKQLAVKSHFPPSHLTGDLELGTSWRNDPSVSDPIVVVSFAEEEKLGTFHRFAPIRDQHLYQTLCERARRDLAPNQVLAAWWDVMARREIMRQLSVRRLAEYVLYLNSNTQRLPDAAREGLYILSLLPSHTFFDHASSNQLFKQFQANRQLLSRIETLSNTDRNRLSRSLEALSGPQKAKLQTTIGRVLRYNRSGRDEDRRELWAEDILRMLDANKPTAGTKARGKGTTTTERAATEAIFADDKEEIVHLGERLRQELSKQEEEPNPRITIDLVNREGQAIVPISSPLLSLLRRSITPECLGGVFRSFTVDSLDQAMDELDRAEFEPFLVSGNKTADFRIRAVVENGYVEPDLLTTWETFCHQRAILAHDVATIAVSPLVALTSDKALLTAAQVYLEAYERLLAIIKDRFELLTQKSPKGIRTLGAQLLTMDIVMVLTRTGLKAVLSPLHPLHLWKFVKLAAEIDRDKKTLDSTYKDVLSERAENLPHFVTAVFIPEGLVSEQALVLPESGHVQTLPIYQQDDLHFSGPEGQDRILRLLEKFVVLYRHAKACLRICLVDPPEASSLLEQIASKVIDRELDVHSLHISVYRTLERPVTLGGNDQQLEAIAEVFSDNEARAFLLELHAERTTYADIMRTLARAPTHVLVVFDPSTSQVGQFLENNRGVLHPLVLPKQFRYDAMEDELVITPAATGGIFDLYHSLQSRLNNALSGSHFGISSTLGGQFPKTGDILHYCTWLVIADRLLDSQPLKGGHMISYEQGARRDVVVVTESLTKFEREFDYQLRQANFDPTPEAVRELIQSSTELIGEGLLGLIRYSERDQDVF